MYKKITYNRYKAVKNHLDIIVHKNKIKAAEATKRLKSAIKNTYNTARITTATVRASVFQSEYFHKSFRVSLALFLCLDCAKAEAWRA